MIDGVTNTVVPSTSNENMAISNNTYGGINVIATLDVSSYPVGSSNLLSQKFVMKIKGGYNVTTPSPLSMIGFTPLWYNLQYGYYVYRQSTVAINSNFSFILKNLTNPQPYQ